MPNINGVDIVEPQSGGGNKLMSAIGGFVNRRIRARQRQNEMVFQTMLRVAGDAASTEAKTDVAREALVKDFGTIYARYPKGHERAGEYVNPELATHTNEAGLEAVPSGYKWSPSSLTKLDQAKKGVGPFAQYNTPAAGVVPTSGPKKPKKNKSASNKGKATPAPAPANTATINDTEQVINPPNVGNRAPRKTQNRVKPVTAEKTTVTTGGGLTEITPAKVKTGKRGTSRTGEPQNG